MVNFSLEGTDARVCDAAAKKFCDAHPDENWLISAWKEHDEIKLGLRPGQTKQCTEITIHPTPDSDSVLASLEQLRDALREKNK